MIIVFGTLIFGILVGLFQIFNLVRHERFWIPDKWIASDKYSASWGVVMGLIIIFILFMCMGIYTFIDKGMLA